MTTPPEGGILQHYAGCLYPRKCFPFHEATYATDIVKRYCMTLILSLAQKEMILPMIGFILTPWKFKRRVIALAVGKAAAFSDNILSAVFLKPEYYCRFSKAVRTMTEEFLTQLGVPAEDSLSAAKALATVLEYDDAYRYRIEDVLSEFTFYDFYFRPSASLKKAREIIAKRDHQVGWKFAAFIRIARIALLSSRVRKAMRAALNSVAQKFHHLQMDKADRYHSMLREGYDYGGMTTEQRIAWWIEAHGGNPPDQQEITA